VTGAEVIGETVDMTGAIGDEVTGTIGDGMTGVTGDEVTGVTGDEVTGVTGEEVTGFTGEEVTGDNVVVMGEADCGRGATVGTCKLLPSSRMRLQKALSSTCKWPPFLKLLFALATAIALRVKTVVRLHFILIENA
jgi:hypothetical protein